MDRRRGQIKPTGAAPEHGQPASVPVDLRMPPGVSMPSVRACLEPSAVEAQSGLVLACAFGHSGAVSLRLMRIATTRLAPLCDPYLTSTKFQTHLDLYTTDDRPPRFVMMSPSQSYL